MTHTIVHVACIVIFVTGPLENNALSPISVNKKTTEAKPEKIHQKKIPCLHYALCVKRGKCYYNPISQYNPNNIIVSQNIACG